MTEAAATYESTTEDVETASTQPNQQQEQEEEPDTDIDLEASTKDNSYSLELSERSDRSECGNFAVLVGAGPGSKHLDYQCPNEQHSDHLDDDDKHHGKDEHTSEELSSSDPHDNETANINNTEEATSGIRQEPRFSYNIFETTWRQLGLLLAALVIAGVTVGADFIWSNIQKLWL